MVEKPVNITMEGVTLLYPNFSGREDMYNTKGQRNFNILLEPGLAQQMERDGWNVKFKEADEEKGLPDRWLLEVHIRFDVFPPKIVMITSRGRTFLGEAEVGLLDYAEILNVDLILRPYVWDVNGKGGVKAYLQSLYITIQEDELEKKYADKPIAGQTPQEN